MKIKYLGTAAAECIPALFCECETCKKAKELGGKNIRSRTQLLVNDDLLVDYPPDSFFHFQNFNVDFSKIKNLIITHNHEDHFYPLDFEYFLKDFSHPKSNLPFTIHGSEDLYEPLKNILENPNNQGLKYENIEPYKTYKIGKYFITPLEATHGTNHPYIYLISDSVKTIFYCHDSGLLSEKVYEYLCKNPIKCDLISLDCTAGNSIINYSSHMCLERNRITVKRLKDIGIIDQNTKIVINHFSHNGADVLYDDLCAIVKDDGFIVSYDGLEIEL